MPKKSPRKPAKGILRAVNELHGDPINATGIYLQSWHFLTAPIRRLRKQLIDLWPRNDDPVSENDEFFFKARQLQTHITIDPAEWEKTGEPLPKNMQEWLGLLGRVGFGELAENGKWTPHGVMVALQARRKRTAGGLTMPLNDITAGREGNAGTGPREPVAPDRSTVAANKAPPHCPASQSVLGYDDYQRTLGILRCMSLCIEHTPSTFAALSEQEIRDFFLVYLNGQFKGGSTSETFNRSGKTDLLVRFGGRNIFIAECKFWHGPAGFGKAIDQLLGYLTWRDCKCALLIFNRNKGTTAVAKKIHETMTARKEYNRTVARDVQGDSQYVFVKAEDSSGEILITTQLFNVPRTLKRPGETRKSRPKTAKR